MHEYVKNFSDVKLQKTHEMNKYIMMIFLSSEYVTDIRSQTLGA